MHDVLQHSLDIDALLGTDFRCIQRRQANDLFYFLLGTQRIGSRQVDLIEHRQDLQFVLHGQIRIGQCLRLHALAGVHHQQRTFTGGQRAGHLVVEVYMAGGIDQVQRIRFAILRLIEDLHGAGLNGNAALFFQIHIVQQLVFHIALRHGVALLQQAVGQRRLAVVYVGNNRKIANFRLIKHTLITSGDQWFSVRVRQRSSTLWNTCAALWLKPG